MNSYSTKLPANSEKKFNEYDLRIHIDSLLYNEANPRGWKIEMN